MADDVELDCLAKNIYYEARGESIKGMQAVGQVTINRVNSNKFPSTICGVVHQKYQFSWTVMKLAHPKGNKWELAKWIAYDIQQNPLANFNALYFHNKTVNPGWKKKVIAKIGNHIFYA